MWCLWVGIVDFESEDVESGGGVERGRGRGGGEVWIGVS